MLSSVAAACSSKLNLRQKRLRSARPQARLIRLPKGEWMTSCMPPASSKKRSSTIVSLRRQAAERRMRRRAGSRPAARPAASAMPSSSVSQRSALVARPDRRVRRARDLGAQPRHRRRQLVAAARRLAEPERNGRRLALRVLDAHHAALDAQDAVARLPSWKMSPARLSTAKSSFTRADDVVLGLEHHLVVGVVGDGAAGGERGQPRAAPAAQHAVDRVVVDQRAAPAAPRGEALGQHARRSRRNPRAAGRDRARRAAPARTARPRSTRCAATSATICCASTSSGCSGIVQPVELAAPHAVEQRRAFDQLVARQREQPALGRAADRVAGAADALQEARDRARRAELADEVDVADVDAELERGGGDQRLQLAALQPLLGVEALLLGEAAVMRGDIGLAEPARTAGAPRARPCGAC